jgi:hypothetical protein
MIALAHRRRRKVLVIPDPFSDSAEQKALGGNHAVVASPVRCIRLHV